MTNRIGFTQPDFIPFVVDRVIAEFRCCIPVVPNGDEAGTAPLASRTARCGHRTFWLVGSAPTCPHHIQVATEIGHVTFRDDRPWLRESCGPRP